jgi:hypothetical protein
VEYKVAREKALAAMVNIARDGDSLQLGLATFPNLLPLLLQFTTDDSPSPECRKLSVWAISKIAQNPATAPLLLTPADSDVDLLQVIFKIIADAGEDLSGWKRGSSCETWALLFLMNISQSEFAVPYLRVAGVQKVLAPLVKQQHYQALKASATIAYLIGGDEDGDLYDTLANNKHSIDRIIDLLDNTLNLKGCDGDYGYGKLPSQLPNLHPPLTPPLQASSLSTVPSVP